jgi:hypothetical protein
MRKIAFVLATAVALACLVAFIAPASEHAEGAIAPIFGIKIYPGYRDWKLISVAHEAGNLNDIRAILGNDKAIEAYREGKQSFPDGTVIARLSWNYVASAENNKVFGREQSFVAGSVPDSICSSWLRIQGDTLQPAGGSMRNLTRTENLPTRRSMERAFRVTRPPRIATTSLPTTHPSAVPHTM